MAEDWHSSTLDLFTAGEWDRFEEAVRTWLDDRSRQPGDGELFIDDALLAPSEYTYAQSVHKWMKLVGMPDLADRIDLPRFREHDPLRGSGRAGRVRTGD
jgi:hypothetical protein